MRSTSVTPSSTFAARKDIPMNQNQKQKFEWTPNRKLYLISALIALALTILTAFSVTVILRNLANSLLASATDEALIDLLTPLRYIRLRISLLPTAIGALVVSLPVYRTAKAQKVSSRIGWIVLILFLLSIIWIISLLTLRIGLASLVKIIFTLLQTLLRLI